MKTNVFQRWERIEIKHGIGSFSARRRLVVDDLNEAERTRTEFASKGLVPEWAVLLGNTMGGTKPVTSDELLRSLEETGELPSQEPLQREIWAIKEIDVAKLVSFANHVEFGPSGTQTSTESISQKLRLLLAEIDEIGTWTLVSANTSILSLEFLSIVNVPKMTALLKKAYAFNVAIFSAHQKERPWIAQMKSARAVTLGYI